MKEEIIGFIVNCFTEEEQELLKGFNDRDQRVWYLKEQLENRYFSKYLSFAPIDELKEHIQKRISEYKPLINTIPALTIRQQLFDRLEKEVFVSYPTHLWNQEMFNNLKKTPIDSRVEWAVERIIESIRPELLRKLSLRIDNKNYDLRTLLLSRWNRALLLGNKKIFENSLSKNFLYNSYSIHFWNKNNYVTRWELQCFLENIDLLFIYPNKKFRSWQRKYTNDEGLSVGHIGSTIRLFSACTFPSFPIVSGFILFLLITFLVLFLTWG